MGKAIIKKDFGGGKYSIEVQLNHGYTNTLLSRLDAKISHITTQINSPPDGTTDAQVTFMRAERLSLQKRHDLISEWAVIENYEISAWCCDLTEGLVGTVATLEIGTEHDIGINIFPAYEDGSGSPTYSIETHGELLPFLSLPLADSLRNFIAMPAIQKWAPTFRYGEILAIDYDNNDCTVGFPYTQSSIGALPINQTNNLSNVLISYMNCNAAAFEVGDDVTVQFINHDWSNPIVVGFKSHPKPCGWEEPWDGPSITSKHPWAYIKTYTSSNDSSVPDANLSIANGAVTMDVPDTAKDRSTLNQTHLLYYMSHSDGITKNVNTISINASGEVDCLWRTYQHFGFYVGGFGSDDKYVQIRLNIINSARWPGIGCINQSGDWDENDPDYDYDWTLSNQLASYDPYQHMYYGYAYGTYRRWAKTIHMDLTKYYSLPEPLKKVQIVALHLDSAWVGGAAYQQPLWIPGAKMTCTFLGLA